MRFIFPLRSKVGKDFRHEGKVEIALGLYCVAVLYLSSLPAKELPDQTAMVPDKVLHMIEYALMGILLGERSEPVEESFPGLLVFCVCFGTGRSVCRIGWTRLGIPYGMRLRMRRAHSSACCFPWF